MTTIENRALDPVGETEVVRGGHGRNARPVGRQFHVPFARGTDRRSTRTSIFSSPASASRSRSIRRPSNWRSLSPVANSPAVEGRHSRRRPNPADRQDQHARNVAARRYPAVARKARRRPSRFRSCTKAKTKPEEVTVVRENIQGESVLGDTRNPDGSWNFFLDGHDRIGYLRITASPTKRSNELRQALAWMTEQGMRGLVLDLRDDPGGYLAAAVDVCDLFIESGEIVTTRGREGRIHESYSASGNAPFTDFPIAVRGQPGHRQRRRDRRRVPARPPPRGGRRPAHLRQRHRAGIDRPGAGLRGDEADHEELLAAQRQGHPQARTAPPPRTIGASRPTRAARSCSRKDEFERWQVWRTRPRRASPRRDEAPAKDGRKPFVDRQRLRAVEYVEKEAAKRRRAEAGGSLAAVQE